MPTLFAETEFNSLKSFILLLIIFIPLSSYGSTNSVTDLEDELSTAVQNDDSVAIQRLTKDPLLAESIYAVRIQAHAYDEGAFGFNVDKNLALELYLKAKSMGDSISALSAGLLYHQEGNKINHLFLMNCFISLVLLIILVSISLCNFPKNFLLEVSPNSSINSPNRFWTAGLKIPLSSLLLK